MEWVTGFAAVVALCISIYSIMQSNKHALFERRLNAYLKVKWLAKLCDQNKEYYLSYYTPDKCNEPDHTVDLLFIYMTNCAFLEEVQISIENQFDVLEKKKYLLKIEELRNLCEEVQLIFPDNLGHALADFVFYYHEMLSSIYKYKLYVDKIGLQCQKENNPFPKNNQYEIGYRKEMVKLISGTFELSERLFKEKTLEKAKEKIKLSKFN